MISVPTSMAVLAILAFLGIKLTAAQSAMVVAGVVVAVKIAIALGAATVVTKLWQKFSPKKAAEIEAPPSDGTP